MVIAEDRAAARRRALRHNRNFWLLALGQGVSRLGDGLYAAALVWTAWSLTRNAQAVAMITLAAGLPAFALILVGASFADRYDRRRLMIGCDVARAALVLPLPLLLHAHRLDLAGLGAIAALVGAAGAPFAPACNAFVPEVVGGADLLAANGLLQVSFRSAFFVGPLLLAPLVALVGLPGVFAVDAVTFVCSVTTLVALRLSIAGPLGHLPGLWTDLVDGWRALRRAPDVQVVIATFVLAILVASGFLTVGVAALVGTQLHGSAGQYGLLLGVAGLAEVGGALLLARLPLRNLARTAVLAWVVLGLFRLPLGFVTALPAAAMLLAVTGLASAVTDIPLIALVQARIPDRHRAKALGLWEAGIVGASAVAPPLAAFVLTRLGLRGGFALCGGALVVLGASAALLLARSQARRPAMEAPRGA